MNALAADAGYSRESVIAAYKRVGNIRGACAETGCSPYTAYIWLQKAGLLSSTERMSYGTRESQAGARAEKEFQRLIPRAVAANAHVQDNCPSFDFMIGEITVDVKYSGMKGYWKWRMPGAKPLKPDFVVVFLSNSDNGVLTDGYRVLLIPVEMFPDHRGMTLSKNNPSSPFWDFEIEPAKLAEALAAAGEDA